MYILQRVI